MGSKGNLAREHQKAHLHLESEIHFHLLLEVFRHLGVHFHSGVRLRLEVNHLLLKVHSPFLVVLHSHEEDYHYLL
jgi:hypothetical protein